MLNNLGIRLVKFLLGRDLTLNQRNSLIVHILDDLGALPIHGIISTSDDGEILINGRSLDIEKAKQLRESARIVLDSVAFKVVNQEVSYSAVVGGVHKAVLSEDMYFYRSAIWFGQQFEKMLKMLAQREEPLS